MKKWADLTSDDLIVSKSYDHLRLYRNSVTRGTSCHAPRTQKPPAEARGSNGSVEKPGCL